jgi:hypothetical protein
LVHDEGLRDLYQKLMPLLKPGPEPERRKIGFQAREKDEDEEVISIGHGPLGTTAPTKRETWRPQGPPYICFED